MGYRRRIGNPDAFGDVEDGLSSTREHTIEGAENIAAVS